MNFYIIQGGRVRVSYSYNLRKKILLYLLLDYMFSDENLLLFIFVLPGAKILKALYALRACIRIT